jgi:hypothetical protein
VCVALICLEDIAASVFVEQEIAERWVMETERLRIVCGDSENGMKISQHAVYTSFLKQ